MLKGVHIGWVVPDSKHTKHKFLAACQCGTEGRFVTEQEAKDWMAKHLENRNGEWRQ